MRWSEPALWPRERAVSRFQRSSDSRFDSVWTSSDSPGLAPTRPNQARVALINLAPWFNIASASSWCGLSGDLAFTVGKTPMQRETITPDLRGIPAPPSRYRGYALKMAALFGMTTLTACVPTAPPPSRSCPSDCSKRYEAAMTACKTAPPDPTGVDSIQSCMDTAERSYGDCQVNCTTSSID